MPITHAKVSSATDGSDSSQVQPSDWNDDHVGAGLFVGCRYPIQNDGNAWSPNDDQTISNWLGGGASSSPHYAVGGFPIPDETGYLPNGLIIPADGFYRISTSLNVDFGGSDSTYVLIILASPERDNDWDTADHASAIPGPFSSFGLTVTHWLAAGDHVTMGYHRDGTTGPYITGALEVIFVGAGANPAL